LTKFVKVIGLGVIDAAQVLAANLRRHRSARGLSQQALADKAGLSRVGYRDVEAGNVAPRFDTLQRIAEALGVQVQDLLVPVRQLTHVRFRAHKRMSTRENVLADTARWLDYYTELEDLLGDHVPWKLEALAKQVQRMKPGPARARKAAELAREHLGLKRNHHEELIRDVGGLLDDHGVKVLTADVKSEGFFGLSVAAKDAGPAVVVNVWDRISVERRIFTAVHELAHLLMHPSAYDVDKADEVDAEEKEADAFAGLFLMPESLFQKEWAEARGLGLVERVFKVKRIFRVSWQTVLYRVAAAKKPAERRIIWQQFNLQYQRQHGRAPLRSEEPQGVSSDAFLARPPVARAADEPVRLAEEDFREDRLLRLVRLAVEQQKITMSRAAEILGCDLVAMRELAASWVG
jgi:Zn-dependent peptidase ImmA (M78 family)/DNA-binding XRE family transcriptional regulator